MNAHKKRQFLSSIKKKLCRFHWVPLVKMQTQFAYKCPLCNEVLSMHARLYWLKKLGVNHVQ